MWVSDIGYLASAFVFAGFCMHTMIPLRVAAICSNITFIAYGALGGIYPVLILHLLLLPMNIWHISQTLRLKKQKRRQHSVGNFSIFCFPTWKYGVTGTAILYLGSMNAVTGYW